MKNTFFLLIIGLALTACHRGKVYEEFIEVPEPWNNEKVIRFNVNITDTANAQNVYLSVRNTGKYGFSNLYLFVTAHSPNGSSVRDTVEIRLADEHGKWLGRGAASVFTLYHPYRQHIRFPFRGIYTFDVEQAMWVTDLSGLTDIGLKIEKDNTPD
jgi:gliding motility-associated lipoprotein GldH